MPKRTINLSQVYAYNGKLYGPGDGIEVPDEETYQALYRQEQPARSTAALRPEPAHGEPGAEPNATVSPKAKVRASKGDLE